MILEEVTAGQEPMLDGFDITTNRWKTSGDGRYTVAAGYEQNRSKEGSMVR